MAATASQRRTRRFVAGALTGAAVCAAVSRRGSRMTKHAAVAVGVLALGSVIVRAARSAMRRPRVVVLHGKGLDTRGYENVKVFGKLTLRQYNRRIRKWARWLGLSVSIYHSNSAEQLAHRLKEADSNGTAAVIMNPGALLREDSVLIDMVKEVSVRVVEVHTTNPASRGGASVFASHVDAAVVGFGVDSYRVALEGVAEDIASGKRA